jgi:hypothetical protein
MDPKFIFIIVATSVALLYMAYLIVKKRQDIKILYNIKDILLKINKDIKIDLFDYDEIFQLSAETSDEVILMKVLNINPNSEIIITNSNMWGINKNIKNFKKSTTPDFVPLVSEFIDYKTASDKPVKKIALINPDCHNITKYLNESDVIKVDMNKPVDGIYFIKYGNLANIFKKQ